MSTATKLHGCYDIFPLSSDPDVGIGLPAWRWMATVEWVEPGDDERFKHFLCKRSLCPLRLMHWISLVALRLYREHGEKK